MKTISSFISKFASKITPQNVQFTLVIITLILFVLAAGAPGMDGGISRN
jgi:hypothetical protein